MLEDAAVGTVEFFDAFPIAQASPSLSSVVEQVEVHCGLAWVAREIAVRLELTY